MFKFNLVQPCGGCTHFLFLGFFPLFSPGDLSSKTFFVLGWLHSDRGAMKTPLGSSIVNLWTG